MSVYARQTITTKHVPATDTEGSHIVARSTAGRMKVGWDHGLNVVGNHAAAAVALATRLGWTRLDAHIGQLVGGGYVVVFVDPDPNGTRVLVGRKPEETTFESESGAVTLTVKPTGGEQ